MLGGGGVDAPLYLLRYAIPSVVTNDVDFAFDVVFAVKPRREILLLIIACVSVIHLRLIVLH
jgi:hypothetical protein